MKCPSFLESPKSETLGGRTLIFLWILLLIPLSVAANIWFTCWLIIMVVTGTFVAAGAWVVFGPKCSVLPLYEKVMSWPMDVMSSQWDKVRSRLDWRGL